MSEKPKSFEMEVCLAVASAIQIGIAVWNDSTVQAMPEEARAELMANVSKTFAAAILEVAEKKCEAKSS